MKEDQTTMIEQQTMDYHLEPRVAKLEVGLDRLTDTVKDLAIVTRAQGESTEKSIQALTVAVTQAQAPKKTDWGLFIAGVGLILALGAAVLVPLNNSTKDNKDQIEKYHESMVEHQKLDMHPVGLALVKRLEEQLATHTINNQKEFDAHVQMDIKEAEEMRDHFKEQLECQEKYITSKIALVESKADGVQKYNELYIDKLFGRVQVLEAERTKMYDKEHDELMAWRQKAMGLTSPDSVVPLVSRENIMNGNNRPPGPSPSK